MVWSFCNGIGRIKVKIEEIRQSLDPMIITAIVRDTLEVLKEALTISEELAEGDEISWFRLKKHGRMEDLIEQAIKMLEEAPL